MGRLWNRRFAGLHMVNVGSLPLAAITIGNRHRRRQRQRRSGSIIATRKAWSVIRRAVFPAPSFASVPLISVHPDKLGEPRMPRRCNGDTSDPRITDKTRKAF